MVFIYVKVSDQSAYYTCDDHFPLVEKAVTIDLGHDQDQSLDYRMDIGSREATLNSEGSLSYNLILATNFPILYYIYI